MVTNDIGQTVYQQSLTRFKHQELINIAEIPSGLYQITLIGDGKAIKTMKLAIAK
jgi:hypothetical protein